MHHQRRKSGGYVSATTSNGNHKTVVVSDFTRTASRPAMPRRYTPSSQKHSKSSRTQETYDDQPESFPQFCMTCEKQFVPHDDKFLYCSESCRRSDQSSSSSSPSTSALSLYSSSLDDRHDVYYPEQIRDIVPQASPSRPTSNLFASSPPYDDSPYSQQYHESAVSALRSSLSMARPPTPSSPNASGGIWPFRRSSAAPSTTSPVGSYHSKQGYMTAATYDAGYYRYSATDRPLPSRQPHGYAQAKSVELVTPILTR